MGKFVIYTDGGSRGNPGQGASAFVVLDRSESYEIKFQSVYHRDCTNNYAELNAIKLALEYMLEKEHLTESTKIEVKADSSYCVNGLSRWMYNWKNQGTLTDRPNGELWGSLYDIVQKINKKILSLKFIHVNGHSGIRWNEYVDRLVNKAMDLSYGTQNLSETEKVIQGNFDMETSVDDYEISSISSTIIVDDIKVTTEGDLELISNRLDKSISIKIPSSILSSLKMIIRS